MLRLKVTEVSTMTCIILNPTLEAMVGFTKIPRFEQFEKFRYRPDSALLRRLSQLAKVLWSYSRTVQRVFNNNSTISVVLSCRMRLNLMGLITKES